jgi:hypothetical protein
MEIDLQVLGVRRWRDLVTDRNKWKKIVLQAKPHSGLEEEGRNCRVVGLLLKYGEIKTTGNC